MIKIYKNTYDKEIDMKQKIKVLMILCLVVCGILVFSQPSTVCAASINQLNVGSHHTITLLDDGTVWAWGYNNKGQLGDGTTADRTTPVKLQLLSSVKSISCGANHTLAVKNDGTVWAWGNNGYGQLGNGETIDRSAPVQVSNLTGVKQVFSTNNCYSVALKEDGTVWAWGNNEYGQLGDGTKTNKSTPVQVIGLSSIKSIVCSTSFCLALKTDGTVWAWGANGYGQLGDGTTIARTTPVQVSGLTSVKELSASLYSCFALKQDGSVWSWGYNGNYELGDGFAANRCAPIKVTGLNSIKSILCGQHHALALKQDGTVWAWGYNKNGQLGDGTTTSNGVPKQVSDLSNVKSIYGGTYNTSSASGLDYNVALEQDGKVWTWGYNGYGQLGNGTTTNSNKPVQVFEATSVQDIYCQNLSVIAVKEDGTLWAWGYNAQGELGDGTIKNSTKPVKVLLSASAPIKINLKAESDETQINLSWNAVNGATSYTIKKSTTDGALELLADNVTDTTFVDTEVSKGITYRYVVTTVNDKGETITSNEALGILAGTSPELIVNAKDSLKLGEEFTAEIVLNNAVNICAEDLKITYDANLFKYMGSEEIPGLKIYKEVNQGVGTLRFIIASKGKTYAINGQNPLVALKFQAIKPGNGTIDIAKGRIADNGTIEMDVAAENCGEKNITILGSLDVNRSGEFTLLDLAIDAWYFGDKAEDTDTTKYDADVVTDGIIDDADLSEIVAQILNNSNYDFN